MIRNYIYNNHLSILNDKSYSHFLSLKLITRKEIELFLIHALAHSDAPIEVSFREIDFGAKSNTIIDFLWFFTNVKPTKVETKVLLELIKIVVKRNFKINYSDKSIKRADLVDKSKYITELWAFCFMIDIIISESYICSLQKLKIRKKLIKKLKSNHFKVPLNFSYFAYSFVNSFAIHDNPNNLVNFKTEHFIPILQHKFNTHSFTKLQQVGQSVIDNGVEGSYNATANIVYSHILNLLGSGDI